MSIEPIVNGDIHESRTGIKLPVCTKLGDMGFGEKALIEINQTHIQNNEATFIFNGAGPNGVGLCQYLSFVIF